MKCRCRGWFNRPRVPAGLSFRPWITSLINWPWFSVCELCCSGLLAALGLISTYNEIMQTREAQGFILQVKG